MATNPTVQTEMTIDRLEQFFDAWNAHDAEAVVSFFTPDGEYLASSGPDPDGTVFRGIEEVRRGVRTFMSMYPDGRYTDARVAILGDRGYAQWTFHGTTPEGTKISYRGVDILTFSGDRIRLKDAFRKQHGKPIGLSE